MQQPQTAVRRLSDFLHDIAGVSADGKAFARVMANKLNILQEDVKALHNAYTSILELFDEAIAEGESIENPAQKQLFLAPILEFHERFNKNTIQSGANSFYIVE